jgi:hypothetical protein
MTALTAEPRPNATVAVLGLLARPSVLAALVEAFADEDSRALLADAVSASALPLGGPHDGLYDDALAALADALRHTWVSVPARDLAGVVEVVVGLEARALVGAA